MQTVVLRRIPHPANTERHDHVSQLLLLLGCPESILGPGVSILTKNFRRHCIRGEVSALSNCVSLGMTNPTCPVHVEELTPEQAREEKSLRLPDI